MASSYSISRIITDVKVLMYQNDNLDSLVDSGGLQDLQSLNIDKLIEGVIEPAINKVYALAPAIMFAISDTVLEPPHITWDNESDNYASIGVTDTDVIRILSVYNYSWDIPVTEMTSFSDPRYSQFRSEFAGIRPTKHRPAVVFDVDKFEYRNNELGHRLEAYPKPNIDIDDAEDLGFVVLAVKKPKPTNGNYKLAEKLYDAIKYTIASLFYVSIGDNDRAAMMDKEATELMNIHINNK